MLYFSVIFATKINLLNSATDVFLGNYEFFKTAEAPTGSVL